MNWARTLRLDAPLELGALASVGVRVRIGDAGALGRTYALVEGSEGVDPSELAQRIPDGRWYERVIIALAIEPLPPDALPPLARALGGPGAPAGVRECVQIGPCLVVEFAPDVTPVALVSSIIDVELRPFGGARRTQLLTPVPAATLAAIAAQGLQAPEIASDRILESLLGLEHVE